MQKRYITIFSFFFVQPINVNLKPFPIHIYLKGNGSASDQVISLIEDILKILKEKHITVDFVATDGDHKYDQFHEDFFEIIFNLHKSNMSFKQIIDYISKSNIIRVPISDFLHLLKILRSNLVKYGLVTENKNSITVTKESLMTYEMGKSIFDLSSHGKMKDNYPLEIFSSKNILNAIEKNDYAFIFYSLPINLLINSIRNPDLSHDLRFFNLEYKESVWPPISRIGLIPFINHFDELIPIHSLFFKDR